MDQHPRPRDQGDGLEEYSAIEPTSDAAEDIQPSRVGSGASPGTRPGRDASAATRTTHGAMHDEAAVEAEEEVDFTATPGSGEISDVVHVAGLHGAMHDEAAVEADEDE